MKRDELERRPFELGFEGHDPATQMGPFGRFVAGSLHFLRSMRHGRAAGLDRGEIRSKAGDFVALELRRFPSDGQRGPRLAHLGGECAFGGGGRDRKIST